MRQARIDDIPGIMAVVKQAQEYLKSQGLDQWQNGYPTAELFASDIQRGECYVLCDDIGVAGVMTVTHAPEECYVYIENGAWLNNGTYGALHRIALAARLRGKGLGSTLFEKAEALCREHGDISMRVDTHEHNRPMRGLIESQGYTYCGVVYLFETEPRMPRVAYEKFL